MKEFKNYHPIVNFIYFLFIIGFSAFFMHPFCLFVSLFCGILYLVVLKGVNKAKKSFLYILVLMILTSLINPLFNHEGNTILLYFPNGNALTLESVVYGFYSALMIGSVINWFSSFNEIMTSDKIIYLFGKTFPSISLIFSMTLSFIPRFIRQFKKVYSIQKILKKKEKERFIDKFKLLVLVCSMMITWSLENAIETADSMKARGYGQKKRTAFSIYDFTKRDLLALALILALGAFIIFGAVSGNFKAVYFPIINTAEINIYFSAYFLLCFMPFIIEVSEVIKWKSLK